MTSIWAEWFKQNGMTHAEERQRMGDLPHLPSDQPQVGRIEQLSDKPICPEFTSLAEQIEQGMLKQQADEIKRLKGALKTVRVWAQVAYQRYGPSYPEIEDEFGDIIGKCDEALKE